MKTQSEIIEELEILYRKRLQLRIDRMMRNSCRNCVNKNDIEKEDDGIRYVCYKCKFGLPFHHEGRCEKFKCVYSKSKIEDEMRHDIENPAVRGAKEPKIAALMWVLSGSGDEKSWTERFLGWFKK